MAMLRPPLPMAFAIVLGFAQHLRCSLAQPRQRPGNLAGCRDGRRPAGPPGEGVRPIFTLEAAACWPSEANLPRHSGPSISCIPFTTMRDRTNPYKDRPRPRATNCQPGRISNGWHQRCIPATSWSRR